jgi:hypothetical protein
VPVFSAEVLVVSSNVQDGEALYQSAHSEIHTPGIFRPHAVGDPSVLRLSNLGHPLPRLALLFRALSSTYAHRLPPSDDTQIACALPRTVRESRETMGCIAHRSNAGWMSTRTSAARNEASSERQGCFIRLKLLFRPKFPVPLSAYHVQTTHKLKELKRTRVAPIG